jgi:hypothetical protein
VGFAELREASQQNPKQRCGSFVADQFKRDAKPRAMINHTEGQMLHACAIGDRGEIVSARRRTWLKVVVAI